MPPPCLPMYSPAATPDGWFRTVAPGGYEAWTVRVSDAGSGVAIVATLMAGCGYHPEYLGEYARYRARPTAVAPPLPAGWPCAHLVLFRGQEILLESLTRFPAEMFVASENSLDVNVGLSRLVRLPDSLRLEFRGRPMGSKGIVQLDLTMYTISGAGVPQRLFAEATGGGEHRWGIVASPCTVKGQLQFRLGGSGPGETIALGGRAAVEHVIGTRPVGDSFSAWMTGAAFLAHSVVPLRVACAKSRPAEAVVAMFDDDGGFHPMASMSGRTSWTRGKRAYPTAVDAGAIVRLDDPKVVASRGPLMNVLYRATAGNGQAGQAVCQVLHPDALPKGARRMFLEPKPAQVAVVTSGR